MKGHVADGTGEAGAHVFAEAGLHHACVAAEDGLRGLPGGLCGALFGGCEGEADGGAVVRIGGDQAHLAGIGEVALRGGIVARQGLLVQGKQHVAQADGKFIQNVLRAEGLRRGAGTGRERGRKAGGRRRCRDDRHGLRQRGGEAQCKDCEQGQYALHADAPPVGPIIAWLC